VTRNPRYVDHVQLHLNGVVQAPDATPHMRTLATQIIEALNNAKTWVTAGERIRSEACQDGCDSIIAALNAYDAQ